MPFRWTINPYRGCAFGCRYCYARYTHEWLGLDPDEDFEKRVLVKEDVAEVLSRDLVKLARAGRVGEGIAVGTATDPYQPLEQRFGLTRAILRTFAEQQGHRLTVTTKSDLVVRDIELLKAVQRHNQIRIHVSITTLDRELARRLDPRAPSPRTRLSTMATLLEAGLSVDAFVIPILPGITDSSENLESLFEALAGIGIRTAVCDVLFLRSPTKEIFLVTLEQSFPELVDEYRRRYESNVYAAPLYVEKLRARVQRLREKWGLLGASTGGGRLRPPRPRVPPRRRPKPPRQRPPRSNGLSQLGLFDEVNPVGPGGSPPEIAVPLGMQNEEWLNRAPPLAPRRQTRGVGEVWTGDSLGARGAKGP